MKKTLGATSFAKFKIDKSFFDRERLSRQPGGDLPMGRKTLNVENRGARSLPTLAFEADPKVSRKSQKTLSIRQIINHQPRNSALIQTGFIMHNVMKSKADQAPAIPVLNDKVSLIKAQLSTARTSMPRAKQLWANETAGATRYAQDSIDSKRLKATSSSLHVLLTDPSRPLNHSISRFLEKLSRNSNLKEKGEESALATELESTTQRGSTSYNLPSAKKIPRRPPCAVKMTKKGSSLPRESSQLLEKQKQLRRTKDATSPFLVAPGEAEDPDNQSLERLLFSQTVYRPSHEKIQQAPSFLSLELFDPLPDEAPELLVLLYGDLDDPSKCYGHSKWAFHDGRTPELRKCQILDYDPSQEKFRIRWDHNGQEKMVARFNLVFDLEDQRVLQARIEEAHQQKERSGLIMKYHYMVEEKTVEREDPVPDKLRARITYRIASMNSFEQLQLARQERAAHLAKQQDLPPTLILKKLCSMQVPENVLEAVSGALKRRNLSLSLLKSLFVEANAAYIKSNKRAALEAELPFSEEKYSMLQPILPPEKFLPPASQWQKRVPEKALIQIEKRSVGFSEAFAQINSRLHSADAGKLKVLTRVGTRTARLAREDLFVLEFLRPMSAADFVMASQTQCMQLIDRVRKHMRNTAYEVRAMEAFEACRVRDVNVLRKQAATHKSEIWQQELVEPGFLQDLRAFSLVLNMRYETGLRTCFQQSVAAYSQKLAGARRIVEKALRRELKSEGVLISDTDLKLLSTDAEVLCQTRRGRLQLEMAVVFSKAKGVLELKPSPQELGVNLVKIVEEAGRTLEQVRCVSGDTSGLPRDSD